MIRTTNKTLNHIAVWRAAALLNRKKHAPHVFIHKHRALAKTALTGPSLNSIAPPPPL